MNHRAVRIMSVNEPERCRVFGSELTLPSPSGGAVWARTTLCENLIQHILIPGAAVSHIRRILVLMAAILSHVGLSYGLLILRQTVIRRASSTWA